MPSTNDTEYSISVAAVDTGGRYREPVDEMTFVASGKYSEHCQLLIICYQYIVPEAATDFMLNQTYLNIAVLWDEVS